MHASTLMGSASVITRIPERKIISNRIQHQGQAMQRHKHGAGTSSKNSQHTEEPPSMQRARQQKVRRNKDCFSSQKTNPFISNNVPFSFRTCKSHTTLHIHSRILLISAYAYCTLCFIPPRDITRKTYTHHLDRGRCVSRIVEQNLFLPCEQVARHLQALHVS